MTRDEITKAYQVDSKGIIQSPGKFEGEMLYVPYFWDAYLNGMADDDDGEVLTFIINQDDKNEFPELRDRRSIRLWASDQGFVHAY